MSPVSRGFKGKRRSENEGRLPPGQYETGDFPVLSAGPTPRTSLSSWDFALTGADGRTARWTWDEFVALPRASITTDIHCVTKWSKFGTSWEGISIDTLIAAAAEKGVTSSAHVMAKCDGGYTTNVPLADLAGGKAWIAFTYDGAPLHPEHGGPAGPIALLLVYAHGMGTVMRCPACDAVVLRIARTPTHIWLDATGALSVAVSVPRVEAR